LGINDKNGFITLAVLFWLLIGFSYLDHTPYNHRSHDFVGHLNNTSILINENRLYKPYELAIPGGETFQQPLYYLLASLFERETFKTDRSKHINCIRSLSIVYGAIALVFIGKILHLLSNNYLANLLTLLLISSTPKFAFIFSTYNNDSITTMFGIISIYYFYKLCKEKEWDKKSSYIFFIIVTCLLYSKLTSLICIGGMVFICIKNMLFLKKPSIFEIRILKIIVCSMLTLLPWFIFNGYFSLKGFSSEKADLKRSITIENFIAVPGIIFRIGDLINIRPGIHPDYSHEWDKPWTLPTWGTIPAETKRYDYFGFVFITSIIGEYVLSSPSQKVIWTLLIIHLIVCLSSLYFAFKSKESHLKFFLILMIVVVCEQIVLLIPFLPRDPNHGFMDYRYISWLWIVWGVFHLNSLISSKGYMKKFLYLVFIAAILLNIYTLQTIEGGFWW
jgi:hypothetical protein